MVMAPMWKRVVPITGNRLFGEHWVEHGYPVTPTDTFSSNRYCELCGAPQGKCSTSADNAQQQEEGSQHG